jgi:ribosomal protein S18 acetylase RimI-like enzyme
MSEIRLARLEDVRRIAEIGVASYRSVYRGIMPDEFLDGQSVEDIEQSWREGWSRPGRRTLVAEDNGNVQGWIKFGACRDADSSDAAEVYGFYLDPCYFRKGIGRRLWCTAIQQIREQGYDRVAVWVLEANTAARIFYEAQNCRLDPQANGIYEAPGSKPLPKIRYWYKCNDEPIE